MGLRIPLNDTIRGGLDRLVVFGLRQQATPAQSGADLADLITRQLRSPAGFTLLPQGTPTNNTDQADAGPDAGDEAAASLRASVRAAAARDWTTRTDGQQFAELLGLDPAVLAGMPGTDLTDQRDARAANTALWPATWGTYLQTALHPVLGPAAVDQTRDFFLRYVSGRGPLPAIRIGRQPYGILPTTAYSKLAYRSDQTHRQALHQILTSVSGDWRAATGKVARLGAPTDNPHQTLLDILAAHPTSAEYYQRYALSVEDIFNRENLGGLGPAVLPALDQLNMPGPLRQLLTRLGYADTGRSQDPDLLRRLFLDDQQPLLAPLIDDRPLSETAPIRAYTPDDLNYLRWLANAAGHDLNTVRLEAGFTDDTPPATLLYLLLRHAVLLGWVDAARNLAVAAGIAQPDELVADPPFVHVHLPAAGETPPSESRFRRLYSPAPEVTGQPGQLLVDYLPGVLGRTAATAQLADQVQALGLLSDVPTARLERLLAEHLDSATYRLDAWRTGQATERLSELRYGADGTGTPTRGLHLGAYGWLEDVHPRSQPLTPVTLTGPLAQIFQGTAPLLHDPANEGFVHAPSPAQARTAAVLRAGYSANTSEDSPDTFAVDLSSARVRVALTVLDGIRQGQSLGALLGYQLERGLHDRYGQAEVDSFIAALRLRFPLVAGKIPDTAADPKQPDAIGQVEARNVVDGLALVRYVTRGNVSQTYPFGLDTELPKASPAQRDALTAEVLRLIDVNDAVADLALAESTHQALSGNPERASATLDAFAKDGFAPEPTVVETPRSGVTLTHRLALRLIPGISPNQGGGNPPRAQGEPAVNAWLPGVLPDASSVAVQVTWSDPVTGQAHNRIVTQDDVDLAPIDLLWTVRPTGEAAMTDLDDRIIGVVVQKDSPRPDAELTIQYTQQIPNRVTFFELSSLIVPLRTLLTTARPLRPSDLAPGAGTAPVARAADDVIALARNRPATVRASLAALQTQVTKYISDLNALYPVAPAAVHRADVLKQVDTFLTRYAQLATGAAGFGLVRSGWRELTTWRGGVFTDILAAVKAVADRMTGTLADADALLAQYDKLPTQTTTTDRYSLLRRIERLLTTKPVNPLPTTPAKFRTSLTTKRKDFNTRLQSVVQIAKSTRSTLSALLADIAALPVTDVDPAGLDLTGIQDRIVAYVRQLLDRARDLTAEIAERLAAADAALADYDHAVAGPDQVRAGTAALRALLGADALVVPEFTPPAAVDTEVRKARGDSDKLVRHLTQAPFSRDFPLDDWLHGLARVRDMPRLWERAVMLSDALRGQGGLLGQLLGLQEPQLTPIQLPYQANDHWLGMEFASGAAITEDRLLFTAHYATGGSLDSSPAYCGLLFDEWTEVIPADKETTGIAVHVDRPDSEPPQAMLLVAPPVRTGAWNTDDLVAAVNETFDLAKARAVEPAHLEDTAYAQLLPATLISATAQPITVSTDLAIANARWRASHD
jgi:hypothetical protein